MCISSAEILPHRRKKNPWKILLYRAGVCIHSCVSYTSFSPARPHPSILSRYNVVFMRFIARGLRGESSASELANPKTPPGKPYESGNSNGTSCTGAFSLGEPPVCIPMTIHVTTTTVNLKGAEYLSRVQSSYGKVLRERKKRFGLRKNQFLWKKVAEQKSCRIGTTPNASRPTKFQKCLYLGNF